MEPLKDEYLHYNVMPAYFGGEIILYNGNKYVVDLPKWKTCIINENPDTSDYYKKMV